jgi:hypothetical protein
MDTHVGLNSSFYFHLLLEISCLLSYLYRFQNFDSQPISFSSSFLQVYREDLLQIQFTPKNDNLD